MAASARGAGVVLSFAGCIVVAGIYTTPAVRPSTHKQPGFSRIDRKTLSNPFPLQSTVRIGIGLSSWTA
ncbi:hypothetical protein JQ616_37500 [Bradyrhizobium tropiciagri]|uniref:hypothetical protein n=1 Tax=Bradyrhizobium tropiciagri TaxID=312253 RepID=UPI001BA907A6|nr:hypothetical protein [Bradyrhizobium tropiciagri]MBR0900682.1 hypothetical protein [Bradyrhizobium tropiciagri]